MARVGSRGGGGGGGGGQRKLLRPGPYLLVMAGFQRKMSQRSGNEYLSLRMKVIGGRSAGVSFFQVFMTDLSDPKCLQRWEMFADACGIPKETGFTVGSYADGDHEEGDADLRRVFRDVPFGAEVEVENSADGRYENNRLGRYVFPKAWPAHWHTWAAEWKTKQESYSTRRQRPEDGLEDPAPADDYTPAGGDEYDQEPPPAYDDGFGDGPRRPKPPAEDDDIPF